jgi:LysM repeat protein
MIKNNIKGHLFHFNRDKIKPIAIIAGIVLVVGVLAVYLLQSRSSDISIDTTSSDDQASTTTKITSTDIRSDSTSLKTEGKSSVTDTRANSREKDLEDELSRLHKQNEELSLKVKSLEKQLRENAAILTRATTNKQENIEGKRSDIKSSEKIADKTRGRESKISYTVKKGDTLWSIADKYGVTVNAIKERNNLRDGHIEAGDELIIIKP